MKVKELIEELKKFDENIEVQYDSNGKDSTVPIWEVTIQNEHYENNRKQVVVLY